MADARQDFHYEDDGEHDAFHLHRNSTEDLEFLQADHDSMERYHQDQEAFIIPSSNSEQTWSLGSDDTG